MQSKGPNTGTTLGVRAHVESRLENPLVLHVEDDDGDAHLVVRCLGQRPTSVRIKRVSDGREAMSMFSEILAGTQDRPDLVLLDLKLPYYNGIEILQRVRSEEAFEDLPVVILTSSDVVSDVEACQAANCSDYVVKPMDYLELKAVLDVICRRYLGTDEPGPPSKELAVVAA